MEQRYALISPDNIVANVIVWNGVDPYTPFLGYFLIQSDTANIGDIYDPENGTFTPPS